MLKVVFRKFYQSKRSFDRETYKKNCVLITVYTLWEKVLKVFANFSFLYVLFLIPLTAVVVESKYEICQ